MSEQNNSNILQTTFSQIRSTLFGEPNEELLDLDNKIDDIIGNLTDTMVNKDVGNYSDSLKDIMTNKIDPYSFDDNVGQSILLSPDNLTRLNRYQNADEVIFAVPTLARALNVLADGILSPDNITKTLIDIMPDSHGERAELIAENLQNINKKLNIDKLMNKVVPSVLKYGDYFLEICDYKSEDVPVTQSLQLTESFNPDIYFKDILNEDFSFDNVNNEFIVKYKVLDEEKTNHLNEQKRQDLKDLTEEEDIDSYNLTDSRRYSTKEFKFQIVEEVSINSEDIKSNDTILQESFENIERMLNDDNLLEDIGNPMYHGGNASNVSQFRNYQKIKMKDVNTPDAVMREKNVDISDVRIIDHNPRNVVKIQSVRHRMNLGYLVIPEYGRYGGSRLGRGVGGAGGIHPAMTQNATSAGPSNMANLGGFTGYDKGVDDIYLGIIKIIKKYVDSDDITVDKDEMKEMLQRAIREVGQNNSTTFKIRYVPPERMEHFYINNALFFPYGEGIFEKVMFQCKLYISLKIAATIKRVSDSADKRVMYVDTTMPRNARNHIEKLKMAMKKRKFSVDTLGNISSIPSMITTNEDYIIPQNKGRKYVEFDRLPRAQDLRSMHEDLKVFRDEIVSALEVPASFVNIEQEGSGLNKASLAQDSFQFAETILSYQTDFSDFLHSFFGKIYKFIYNEKISESDDVIITFPPPKMLKIEKESELSEAIARKIQAYAPFEEDVPQRYLVQKLLSEDWEDIKEWKILNKIENKISPPKPPDDGMGGLGGYGGGMPSQPTGPAAPGSGLY